MTAVERCGEAGRDEHGAMLHAGLIQAKVARPALSSVGTVVPEAPRAKIVVDCTEEVRSLRRLWPVNLYVFLGHFRCPLPCRRRLHRAIHYSLARFVFTGCPPSRA